MKIFVHLVRCERKALNARERKTLNEGEDFQSRHSHVNSDDENDMVKQKDVCMYS